METKKSPQANLENKKMLFREIGLIMALFLAFLSFEWKTYNKTISIAEITHNGSLDDDFAPVAIPEPPQTQQVAPPASSDVILIVDNQVNLPDLVINTENDPRFTNVIRDYQPPVLPEEPTGIDELPAVAVDEKPQFMGGDENEFTKWVFKNMSYPELAKDNNIQGRVICSFVVTPEGKVADVKVLRGVDPSLDKEAVRVISMSPKWTPGKQRNKEIRVRYTFPVIFQLK